MMTFTDTTRTRIRELRKQHDWTQQDLATRLTNLGAGGTGREVPVDRVTIARIETGSRQISVDELFQFALALNVAPVHLFVDPNGDEPIQLTPALECSPAEARAWVRGEREMLMQDPRGYFMNVPRDEFERFRSPATDLEPVTQGADES
jgi:transcriptional regulator with XRE-family HTH domain